MPVRKVDRKSRKEYSPVLAKRRKICAMICLAVCAALFVYIFIKQGVFSGLSGHEVLRVACDAAVVCGLIFLSVFVLNLCHYHGAFDFMFYGVRTLSNLLFRKQEEETLSTFEDFATYLRKNTENKRLNTVYLWFGVGFLAAGIFFLLLYMIG